ncbi:MAG: class I SAM-dependent methyltransferase [Pseudohongiella sp.]|uniref:cyclopropane-fatty-acyl-phospholipid synthase family protein n=1 Tax=Pseudohongiella sp. TaxID=1979412 RepID=UPI0034A01EBD
MNKAEITVLFDQMAPDYDSQWANTAALRNCMYMLLESMFFELPEDAHILCVGAGTGAELTFLAQKHPGWRFTAVEPSAAMLAICQQQAEKQGVASRCRFHHGYLESLTTTEPYDAATCFLVSQFILDERERSLFFADISHKLKAGGLLASADLASDTDSPEYDVLLQSWMHMMSVAGLSSEALEYMRNAYKHDVGVMSPDRTAAVITAGGFALPVLFFQAGLMHAWTARKAPNKRV